MLLKGSAEAIVDAWSALMEVTMMETAIDLLPTLAWEIHTIDIIDALVIGFDPESVALRSALLCAIVEGS